MRGLFEAVLAEATPEKKCLSDHFAVSVVQNAPRGLAADQRATTAATIVGRVTLTSATARTRITLISFDTVWYEADANENTLRGAGGTRAQAVEEFIQQKTKCYPDIVFLLTDGWTPSPSPLHPERWIWLLPPWGSTEAVPKGSLAEFFEAEPPLAIGERPHSNSPGCLYEK